MIRSVLVDDQPEFRQITRRLLALAPKFTVVGEAGNGLEALDVVAQVQPDVVLMDMQMPILDGVTTTTRLHAAYPDVQIVLLTSSDDDRAVQDGLRAGAVGYLRKPSRPDRLMAALRAACTQ